MNSAPKPRPTIPTRILLSLVIVYSEGRCPSDSPHALSRAASSARSVLAARFAALARVFLQAPLAALARVFLQAHLAALARAFLQARLAALARVFLQARLVARDSSSLA